MAVKDILVTLTTYPTPTPISAVHDAIAFATALEAKISAVACEVTMPPTGSILADALFAFPAMNAAATKESLTNAENLLSEFRDVAEKHGVFQDKILVQCLVTKVPDLFVEYARLRDLTIVPVPHGAHVYQWYAESIIFESGRPTLIVPHTRRRTGAISLDTVAVAGTSVDPRRGPLRTRFRFWRKLSVRRCNSRK